MTSLISDSSSKANDSSSDFRNKFQNSGQEFEKMTKSAGERVGAMASDLATSTADSLKSSRDYVKENPLKGVAIAASAGLVAGSLLTMAMRSRKT